MKFILFDIDDSDKTSYIKDVNIDNQRNDRLQEIVVSRTSLSKMMEDNNNFFKKITKKSLIRKFLKIIKKALEKNKTKWYYILSKNFSEDERKYIKIILQELLGYEYKIEGEMDKNIFKYIEEYSNNFNKKKQDIKMLLAYNENKFINISLLKNLINELKCVNLYLKEKPSSYVLKQIKNINNSFGSAIEIIKQDKKAFREYDIVYFINSEKKDFPKFRFGKNSLIIDNETSLNDKFNSNIIFLNNIISSCSNTDLIKEIINNYGKLQTAIAIKNLK